MPKPKEVHLFARHSSPEVVNYLKGQAHGRGWNLAKFIERLTCFHQHARRLARTDEAVARLLVELEID